MGASLCASSLCALLCAHSSSSALARGNGQLLFWRLRLRLLKSHGLQLTPGLVETLELSELKHCAQALDSLRCKRPWHFQEKSEVIQLADVVQAARREQDAAQFFGATVHFLGKPKDAQDEDGGVDTVDTVDTDIFPILPPPWVEGGMFVLPDGSHCQLCTRIMWFDDAGHLIRVIVNHVRAQVPPSVNVDIRLWSAQPDLCQMSGLGIHQACSLEEREARLLLGTPQDNSDKDETPSQSAVPLRVVASVLCTQRFWNLLVT